ncbi:MAG: phage portal protein [Fusobacteriaceae bacterium]
MSLLGKIKNKVTSKFSKNNLKDNVSQREAIRYLQVIGLSLDSVDSISDISETIYFICLKHISETLSKMPWEKRVMTEKKGKEKIFNSEFDVLLNLKPNPYYTATTFWATIELNRLHHGNAFVYIETGANGKAKNLWILPSDQVQIIINRKGVFGKENSIWYVWTDKRSGKKYTFFKDEILHFKSHITFDGFSGASIREILKYQINTGKSSISFLNKLYRNNMFGSKVIVKYTGNLKEADEDFLAEQLERYSTTTKSGKFIPMPLGFETQLIDMKLADAQFFENNRFSALQLAAAFGIKPNIINDYTKSSYSNSETQQIDFYVNTLQPLFKLYEQELTIKLLYPSELKKGYRLEINEKILFKMDSKSSAEYYAKLVMNFMMTPNEAREQLDLPYVEGGDVLIGNGSSINLENVGEQYKN